MAKKTTTKRTRKPAAAYAVTDSFEVKLVRLLNSSSELNVRKAMTPPFQIEITYSVNLHEGAKTKVVLVDVGCRVSLKPNPDANGDDCPFVSAEFQVVFQAKGAFPSMLDSDRSKLATTASVVAWPYLRSHIQATVSMMGLPPVVLPLFHPVQTGGATIGRIAGSNIDQEKTNAQKRKKAK